MDDIAALTAKVKDELARVSVSQESAQAAEIATLFRFARGFHLVTGSTVLEAELDSDATARRLHFMLAELYDVKASLNVLSPGGLQKTSKCVVRVIVDVELIVRQTGLIDPIGHPVRRLPRKLAMGQKIDQKAAWRGTFLARDSLTEPRRPSALEVIVPSVEAALVSVGCACRLGITAKSKENESRGGDRVTAREGDAIGTLFTRTGAQTTRLQQEEQRMRREVRATAARSADFDDANLRRSARTAVIAAARVECALEILGDNISGYSASIGQLCIEHKQAPLEELGQLVSLPMTKDAAAGRIRRSLSIADKRADKLGIPPTTAVVIDELFDKEVDEQGARHA